MNRILAVLLVAWALVAVTVAQRSGASIWGTVQDAAGDPVDGAEPTGLHLVAPQNEDVGPLRHFLSSTYLSRNSRSR